MTEQNSNKFLVATADQIKQAALDGLRYTLGEIKGDIFRAIQRGDTTRAHYLREQYAVTETIIYAIENDRIAKTDAQLKEFQEDI